MLLTHLRLFNDSEQMCAQHTQEMLHQQCPVHQGVKRDEILGHEFKKKMMIYALEVRNVIFTEF